MTLATIPANRTLRAVGAVKIVQKRVRKSHAPRRAAGSDDMKRSIMSEGG
jgi:hypothetical protein